jgi:arabinan endo-1,5-alpha-L-arabinosidase
MRQVDPATGKLSGSDSKLYSLASRRPLKPPAIEAPFIVRRDGYYYLFVSFDMCCRGKDSTYKVMVGRARKITGPYEDREGKPMLEGGGTFVLEGAEAWRGPGHQAVLHDANADLMVFHAYDGTSGRPMLQISTMVWEDGWPRVGRLK